MRREKIAQACRARLRKALGGNRGMKKKVDDDGDLFGLKMTECGWEKGETSEGGLDCDGSGGGRMGAVFAGGMN